jgi:hypothetical protein
MFPALHMLSCSPQGLLHQTYMGRKHSALYLAQMASGDVIVTSTQADHLQSNYIPLFIPYLLGIYSKAAPLHDRT